MLSLLGKGSTDATIAGLDQVAPNDRPPVGKTHFVFDLMVGSGFAMLGIGIWFWFAVLRSRSRVFDPGRWLLWAVTVGGFLGFLAIEAGWFVTEWGRQPWLVVGYLRTSEGVTERSGIGVFFVLFTILYIVISIGLVTALIQWPRGPHEGDEPVPEGTPDVA